MKDAYAYNILDKFYCLDCVSTNKRISIVTRGMRVSRVESKDLCSKCSKEFSDIKSIQAIKTLSSVINIKST